MTTAAPPAPDDAAPAHPGSSKPIRKFTDIPGWFFWIDYLLFTALLEAQQDSPPGTLVEVGTYQGKSAVVIGDHLRPGERFVALDLFGRTDLLVQEDGTSGNRREVDRSYSTLSRSMFEHNYLALHAELPEVVEGLSASIVDHVAPGEARFVHVDASHLYEVVRVDAANARSLLRSGGVVVFDDWRSEHTPGVSAAVWEAVFTAGLIPVALTPGKLYGVYSDPEPSRRAVARLVAQDSEVWAEEQQIAGHQVLRLKLRQARQAAAAPAALPDATVDALAQRVAERVSERVLAQVAERLTPPAPLPSRPVSRLARLRPRYRRHPS